MRILLLSILMGSNVAQGFCRNLMLMLHLSTPNAMERQAREFRERRGASGVDNALSRLNDQIRSAETRLEAQIEADVVYDLINLQGNLRPDIVREIEDGENAVLAHRHLSLARSNLQRAIEEAHQDLKPLIDLLTDSRSAIAPKMNDRRKAILATGHREHIVAMAREIVTELHAEVLTAADTAGYHYPVWRAARSVMYSFFSGDLQNIMFSISQTDASVRASRRRPDHSAQASSAARTAPDPHQSLMEQAIDRIRNRVGALDRAVRSKQEKLEKDIESLTAFRVQVSSGAEINNTELLSLLQSYSAASLKIRELLAAGLKEKSNSEALSRELETIHNEWVRAKDIMGWAWYAYRRIGVHISDFQEDFHMLGYPRMRPSFQEYRNLATNDRTARRAVYFRGVWRNVRAVGWTVWSGDIFAGAVKLMRQSQVWPLTLVAAGAEAVMPQLRVRQLQNRYRDHFLILRRFQGNDMDFRQKVEEFNANFSSTPNEFLDYLSKVLEGRFIWQRLRRIAEDQKDADTHRLFERMVESEARMRNVPVFTFNGTPSILAGFIRGSLRTLLAGGGLAWGAMSSQPSPPPAAAPDDDDDEAKKKGKALPKVD